MRILILDTASNCLDFAMRCQIAGHKVKWWDKPQDNGKPRRAGEGLVEKVKDFNEVKSKWIDWADLIYVPDNVRYIDLLEPYRLRGYPIFNANMEAAKLEVDRDAGQAAMRKGGLETIPGKAFHDYKDAIRYIEKEGRAFVSKPSGDADKALSYVANDAADMVFMLDRWDKNPEYRKMARKDGFILQEKVDGIEMAVGGYFGPHGWNEIFFENFEYKKLCTGDMGVNCYSEDTEVLTSSGWKFWPTVTMEDEICTLRDGKIEFEKPSRLTVGDTDKELVGWQSPYVDILVTPGHNMYVQDNHGRKPFYFEPANVTEQNNRLVLRGAGEWMGENDETQLPSFYTGGFSEWCALLGMYIADGNVHSSGRSVVFGNCPPHKQEVFIEIARQAGYSAKMYGTHLYINSVQLATHFSTFGNSETKFAPEYVVRANATAISAFLYGYGSGDGSTRTGNLVYTTVSEKLANQLQEMCLKVGWCANLKIRDRRSEPSHFVKGYECFNRLISYEIGVSKTRMRANLTPDMTYRQPYDGKVYCCTVTSHIIYVRRNGKACFLGQTGEMGTAVRPTKRSKLADLVLKPFTEQLHKLGYVGFVDNAVMIGKTDGKIYPLEFTISRDGWPIRHNVTSLLALDMDPAQWMLDLINGIDSLRVRDGMTSISVVVPLPPFPYQHVVGKNLDGIPLYNATDMRHIHLSEARLAKDVPVMVDGKVVRQPNLVATDVYPLVVTGLGKTINKARADAYAAVKAIEIPNSPFYRLDIGNGRLIKQLPILQKHGFAKEWKM